MKTPFGGILGEVVAALSELVWPRTCHVCGRVLPAHAEFMCSACMAGLPRIPAGTGGVSVTAERLAGCDPALNAASWMDYARHSPYARLLHDIKYRGCTRLARHLGRTMALDLLPTGFFSGVDVIVPVPLHSLHRLRRGYNQSEMLARGVGEITGLPVTEALRARRHRSQTRLSDEQRHRNVQGVYRPRPDNELFTPGSTTWRHVLVIDDVCTTGATLTQAIEALRRGRADLQVSVLTLALTRRQQG